MGSGSTQRAPPAATYPQQRGAYIASLRPVHRPIECSGVLEWSQ